jgi:hypothetical protein
LPGRAAAVGGVRERPGRAVVSLELAVGARGIVHAFRTRCDGVIGEQELGDAVLVVEPRVRVEAWSSAGAFIGLHTRALDRR